MKSSTLLRWQMFCSLQLLIQSENCFSKYFKVLRGSRFVGRPVERISTESEVACAMKCGNEEWCKAINFIHNAGLQLCELFREQHVRPGQVIKDESSQYYYLEIEGDTNETHIDSVASTSHDIVSAVTPAPTSVSVLASSAVSRQVTSFSAAILPSSAATSLLLMTSSVVQQTTPAVACKKIFQNNPSSTDGPYTIFSGMTGKQATVYCDMTGASTGCGGGGWTMVMRMNGQQTTFEYGSQRWTNKVEYQPHYARFLNDNMETKLSTYHTTPFTQICVGMEYNGVKGWTILNLASTSLYDLISGNTYHATYLDVPKWKGLIPTGNPALQSQCRIQGINAVRGDTGVRIGIIATKTCGVDGDYNSRLGFGAKGWSCGQDGNMKCGNVARCGAVASINTKGYILVK